MSELRCDGYKITEIDRLTSLNNALYRALDRIIKTVPRSDLLSASSNNDALVTYFKNLHKQRDELLEFVRTCAQYQDDGTACHSTYQAIVAEMGERARNILGRSDA